MLNRDEKLKVEIDLLNDIIKNNGGTYIIFKLRQLEDQVGLKKKGESYTFTGSPKEFTQFIKDYPVRLTTMDSYRSGHDDYNWYYIVTEDFKIK